MGGVQALVQVAIAAMIPPRERGRHNGYLGGVMALATVGGGAMALVGIGVGMTMQNLVLAVQNTVALKDIGAASSTVTFFRSLGGTIGVSVLGAVLAHRVTDNLTHELAAAGMSAGGDAAASSSLNLSALPEAVQHLVRVAYGDATGHIFLISAAIAVVGVIAALLMKPTALRSTVDLIAPADETPPTRTAASVSELAGAAAAKAAPIPAEALPR